MFTFSCCICFLPREFDHSSKFTEYYILVNMGLLTTGGTMIAVSGVEVEEGNFNPGATAFNP